MSGPALAGTVGAGGRGPGPRSPRIQTRCWCILIAGSRLACRRSYGFGGPAQRREACRSTRFWRFWRRNLPPQNYLRRFLSQRWPARISRERERRPIPGHSSGWRPLCGRRDLFFPLAGRDLTERPEMTPNERSNRSLRGRFLPRARVGLASTSRSGRPRRVEMERYSMVGSNTCGLVFWGHGKWNHPSGILRANFTRNVPHRNQRRCNEVNIGWQRRKE
jgi:hypothetical protein